MNRSSMLFIAALGLAGCGPQLAPNSPAPSSSVAVEFRKAEESPAEGLTEVTVAGSDKKVYLHPEVELSNADVADAFPLIDQNDKPAVGIRFNKAGQEKAQRLSREQMHKPVAILIDGKVVCAPVIRDEFREMAQINGNFTQAEVDRIVKGIKPLP